MAPRGLELEETGDKSKNNPISAAPTAQEDGGESAVEENQGYYNTGWFNP